MRVGHRHDDERQAKAVRQACGETLWLLEQADAGMQLMSLHKGCRRSLVDAPTPVGWPHEGLGPLIPREGPWVGGVSGAFHVAL